MSQQPSWRPPDFGLAPPRLQLLLRKPCVCNLKSRWPMKGSHSFTVFWSKYFDQRSKYLCIANNWNEWLATFISSNVFFSVIRNFPLPQLQCKFFLQCKCQTLVWWISIFKQLLYSCRIRSPTESSLGLDVHSLSDGPSETDSTIIATFHSV